MTLDQIIYIRTPGAEALNPATGLLETTDSTVKVFAGVRPLSGAERAHSASVAAQAHYRFTIRTREVANDAVIVWESVEYNVRFVANAGKREQYLRIDAERGD